MWDNLASGCADSVHLNPKQEGRVKIDIQKAAENFMIVILVYGELENMMQINHTRSTQYDIYSQQVATFLAASNLSCSMKLALQAIKPSSVVFLKVRF